MSGVTVVVPSIVPEVTRECIDTMRFVYPKEVPELTSPHTTDIAEVSGINGSDVRLVVVFNTPEHNLGVAGSWNEGVRRMFTNRHDWLVICSAGVRFGAAGGIDFLRYIEGARLRWADPLLQLSPWVMEAGGGLGWHLIAFHRSVFMRVGWFDENFHPAYREDNDFSYRIQLAYDIDSRAADFVGPLWPKVPVDATLPEIAHGIKRGGVDVDLVANEAYYVRKWGGDSPHETFTTPFDSGNPVSWCPHR